MKLLNKSFIAVVDDDESAREAIISLVRSLGYQVVAFEGPEAFLAFDRGGVSCLIADVQMPGMTGWTSTPGWSRAARRLPRS